ncbi:TetR/AcrR family transcriptional regulator [Polyangium sp. y55x31]|uniref:TetR/AcrR family transcriptional regulator n=1 Tax=Polyangium sp. y55x31 TaxID=3042688 RepID=UPI0024829131|nr:TetR/AcrR family transcriptional regulator [Polyangium sp. y55x31]MDI1479563.1 TetR family transcriptional regulator [Polyangium sp. y55x31]
MESEQGRGARERIIEAAIEVVEREGIEALTVRAIALQAGVNVAAINYYFGSKERLVEVVLARTLENAFGGQLRELDALVEAEGGDVRAALERFVPELLPDAVRYPRISAAHLHDAIARQDYTGPAVQGYRDFLEGFFRRVRSVLPAGSEEEQRLRVAAFWSAIHMVCLAPRLCEGFVPENLHEPRGAASFARLLLRQLLGDRPEAESRARGRRRRDRA